MRIDVRDNFPAAQAAMRANGKQARFATAVALTRTGSDVRAEVKVGMQTRFDRPTAFTLNSLFLKPATREDLTARVWVKDSERPSHYLLPQIMGGARQQKRFEQLLVQRGVMRAGERAVPGAGAIIDSHGNMARSQITKILSQLQAFNMAGFDANATNSKRSVSKRKREAFFFSTGPGTHPYGRRSWKRGRMKQHLARGIWSRISFGAMSSAVLPVLLFVDRAAYSKRLPFEEISQRTIARVFPGHFDREMAKALATAKPVRGAA
ncbi:hypothetical protein [Variovorax sp. UMC13]|uniref:hypothetical protein n=1 Tax=Variovorax sp. UMC13 TaxID=1862326 RepID=UPI00160207D3|nr:hypothetical protein [Variovorax sp. UMC13]